MKRLSLGQAVLVGLIVFLFATAASCSRSPLKNTGVELVLSSEILEPSTTFELRFEQAVVSETQVGTSNSLSPLVLSPSVPSEFVWFTPRSGVFTPTAPLRMATLYRLQLKPGLKGPQGSAVAARLDRELRTPGFQVRSAQPGGIDTSNAPALPNLRLDFNGGVDASTLSQYMHFQDAAGHRVPAQVKALRHSECSGYAYGTWWGSGQPEKTWFQRFGRGGVKPEIPKSGHPQPSTETAPDEWLTNSVRVWPASPLPPGKGWRLLVERGLPCTEQAGLRLETDWSQPIGDVQPFQVQGVEALNTISRGRRLQILLNKSLGENVIATNITDWVELTPLPTGLEADLGWQGITLKAKFDLERTYALKIKAGLPANEALPLARDFQTNFTFSPVPSRLYLPVFSTFQFASGHRQFPLLSINLDEALITTKLLEEPTLIHALRGYRSYYREPRESDDWLEPFHGIDFNQVPGVTIHSALLRFENQQDQAQRTLMEWDSLLGGRRHGAVALDVRTHTKVGSAGRGLGAQALVQVTEMGLAWFRSPNRTLAYVFSLLDGKPMPGTELGIRNDESQVLAKSVADSQGTALLSFGLGADPAWLMGKSQDDLFAANLSEHGLPLYQYRIPIDWDHSDTNGLEVFLLSDRPTYRPGETLYVKAIARERTSDGLRLPSIRELRLQLLDPESATVQETNLTLSSSGSVAWSTTAPSTPLGNYRWILTGMGKSFEHQVRIADYRPNAFEIVCPSDQVYPPDQEATLNVKARYLHGKRLSKATVVWYADLNASRFAPPGFDFLAFGNQAGNPALDLQPISEHQQGNGPYDATNGFAIQLRFPFMGRAPEPLSGELLVEVTDLNQQTVSHTTTFTRHSSDFYVGLAPLNGSHRPGMDIPIRCTAVGTDGTAWPSRVAVEIIVSSIEWSTVRVGSAGGTLSYRNEPIVQEVWRSLARTLPVVKNGTKYEWTPEADSAPVFHPDKPGQYLLEIRAKDDAGREVVTLEEFSVAGKGELAWNYRNEVQMELVPDKEEYRPGDIAQILVRTPLEGSVLVTVQREHVLRHFTTNLVGNAPLVLLPIEAGDGPNVFASVLLVRGAEQSKQETRVPQYRLGYCKLKVAQPETRLDVTIEPGATHYRPGSEVEVQVRIRDFEGKPVDRAELTVYAVDEGILSLTGYEPPDPRGYFYRDRPLGVEAALTLPGMIPEELERFSFQNKGFQIGGGGGRASRSRFLPCAYWNPGLVTDSAGAVTVRFPCPDTLTRYRLIAVAAARCDQFGAAQGTFEVNKPLMLDPALPPFARVDDELQARGIVHNRTAEKHRVSLTLTLDEHADLGVDGSRRRSLQLDLEPHESRACDFLVRFRVAGQAQWLWEVVADDGKAEESEKPTLTDSVVSNLEVKHRAPLLHEIHLSRHPAGTHSLLAAVNPQLLTGEGTARVRISNSRLGDVQGGMQYLQTYPYGCAEQTASSLLPWVLAPSNGTFFSKPGLQREEAVRVGVHRLFSMQTASGGLSYWPGDSKPAFWPSAYAALALTLARSAGATVSTDRLNRLHRYLEGELQTDSKDPERLSSQALALYALAKAGRQNRPAADSLFKKRQFMSPQGRDWLALGMCLSQTPPELPRELLEMKPTGASLDDQGFESDESELATRLLAWLAVDPDSANIEVLIAELLPKRKEGHWGNTQGNAWALLALTECERRSGRELAQGNAELRIGFTEIPLHFEETPTTILKEFPLTPGTPLQTLVLAHAASHSLYCMMELEVHPTHTLQPRQDRGFALTRTYTRLDDEGNSLPLDQARAGERVLVQIQLHVHEASRFVAIEDPLPAVLEPIQPEFRSKRTGGMEQMIRDWVSDHRELHQDRAMFFANRLAPGQYEIRYLTRVRCAGTSFAPGAQAHAMYRPSRFGSSDSQTLTFPADIPP